MTLLLQLKTYGILHIIKNLLTDGIRLLKTMMTISILKYTYNYHYFVLFVIEKKTELLLRLDRSVQKLLET